MRSGNPALQADTFNVPSVIQNNEAMTVQGTVWKSWFLLLLVSGAAGWSWNHPQAVTSYLLPLALVAFVVGLVTVLKKHGRR